jgi:CheY-like chemotaxis protein
MSNRKTKVNNDFDSFLNECNTYIWEWYVPERYVKFGIPSLDGSWLDDKEKIFRLETVLEKVHPDDVNKIFVRRNSAIYTSDKMFELDLRINATGTFEWYGFRGRTVRRDRAGNPTYIRGVAINVNNRVKAQQKLLGRRELQLQEEKQKTSYCAGVLQEVVTFIRDLASNSDSIITGATSGTREERLMRIKSLKDQCERILELIDRVRTFAFEGEGIEDDEIKQICLWEHLAELQQVYTLKMHSGTKLYFSNMYSDLNININVKLLDLLIENVINSQLHNTRNGYLSINYQVNGTDTFRLVITCTENEMSGADLNTVLTESGLGLSVCRLLAKRMFGQIDVQTENKLMQYHITLPIDARKTIGNKLTKLYVDEEGVAHPEEPAADTPVKAHVSPEEVHHNALPKVLIGLNIDTELYNNQHLFSVVLSHTTDDFLRQYKDMSPDIVFIDYNLQGELNIKELLQQLCQDPGKTPIIVTSDYATRPLHKELAQMGVSYLLSNPMSLRKVNVMVKRYLK